MDHLWAKALSFPAVVALFLCLGGWGCNSGSDSFQADAGGIDGEVAQRDASGSSDSGEDGGVDPAEQKSPFGIFGPFEVLLDKEGTFTREMINDYLRDLKVPWVQEMPDGSASLPAEINVISRVNTAQAANLESSITQTLQGKSDHIKYWEISTEPNFGLPSTVYEPQDYAQVLSEAYRVIHEQCSDCKVVNGGIVVQGTDQDDDALQWVDQMLAAGGRFDVFEFKLHCFRGADYQAIANHYEAFRRVLQKHQIDIDQIEVFVETGSYDGNPSAQCVGSNSQQDETTQALALIKINLFSVAHGVDRVLSMYVAERYLYANQPDSIFNFFGLVHNPKNDGQTSNDDAHKKLAYYSYKLMLEKLADVDWNAIETITTPVSDVHQYRLVNQRTGQPLWVVWNDAATEQTVVLDLDSSLTQAQVTRAVPDYATGQEVPDYATAFKSETKAVSSGKLTLTLDRVPLFIESADK